MINWNLLYDKFGRNKAGQKFEDLALEYVQSVYTQYEWVPTGRTRDGNKDFHLAENESNDIWGEAKYKKTGNNITKKDLDPTILSGLIKGNVRLVIYVTNAYIPSTLIERVILGGKIRNIKVSWVLAEQLESWLYLHRDIYLKYFEEELTSHVATDTIFEIKKISFYNILSQDFNPFSIRHKMILGQEYILNITTYSNAIRDVEFEMDNEFPFQWVNHPSYDDFTQARVNTGITSLTFLVSPQKLYEGCVNIVLCVHNKKYFHVTSEIEIVDNTNLPIVYAKQLELSNRIINLDKFQDVSSFKYIITIYAESGMGKTFLLKNIYMNYMLKKDMTLVTFDSNYNSNVNYLLLCKILLFLFYGNLFLLETAQKDEDCEELKKIAQANNNKDIVSDEILSRIIDGCFDSNIAMTVISDLNRYIEVTKIPLLKGHVSAQSKVLLVDDFQYLNASQREFFIHIVQQIKMGTSNTCLIVAATKNKFEDEDAEEKFLAFSPNHFTLEGLSLNDRRESIGKNFLLESTELPDSIINILPNNILLYYEIIRSLKQYQNEIDTEMDFVIKYIKNNTFTNILLDRFSNAAHCYYLLDIIYRFKCGIPSDLIVNYPYFREKKKSDDIEFLKANHLIIDDDGLFKPYHDYLTSSYLKLRKKNFYTPEVSEFLYYLLEKTNDSILDFNKILSMIIECTPEEYVRYEAEIEKLMVKYHDMTQFGVVIYFGKIIYRRLLKITPKKYSSQDFFNLYLYGNALIHCDENHSAYPILEVVYKNAGKETLERYEAGVQLLNEDFWNANIRSTIADSFIIQRAIEKIQQKNLDSNVAKRILKIYSSCINRRMVTQLLLEQTEDALRTYKDRLHELVNTYKAKYKTYAATLLMDYARGIVYLKPMLANKLMEFALKYLYANPIIHFRRITICHIDIAVMDSIISGNYCEEKFNIYALELLNNSFNSEYFKAILKKCACELIEHSTLLLVNNIRQQHSSFYQDIADEISNAILVTKLVPAGRELFLMNNLMAYISVLRDDRINALKYMMPIKDFVSGIGGTYKAIAKHNIDNLKNITHIQWYKSELLINPNLFLLDTRFW